MKKLVVLPILFCILISIAFASELQITKFTIYVNDEDQGNLKNGSVHNEIIEPGDELEFEIELKNIFKDNTDINDIIIVGKIENITEGVSLFDNITEFDLGNDDSKIKKLHFDIPSDADELQKKVEILIKGVDDKKRNQTVRWFVYLNIDDEEHEIRVYKTKVDQKISACNDTGNIIVLLSNEGSYDEEDVTLKVQSAKLGIDKIYNKINIDEDGTYSKIVPLLINDHNKTGIFPVEIKAYYKEYHLDDLKAVNVYIEACKTSNIQNTESVEENQVEDNNQIVYEDNISEATQEIIASESDASNNNPINQTQAIIVFSIILLVLIIIIITTLFFIQRH